MTAQEIAVYVAEVQASGNTILATIAALDPEEAAVAGSAGAILNLVAVMASKALTAYSAASGVPITLESVLALMPNSNPLPLPDEG